MKRISFLLIIFMCTNTSIAQVSENSERRFYKQGNFEIGFSGGIGISSQQNKNSYTYGFSNDSLQTYMYENSTNGVYTQLGISLGYYIIDGLSFEPEFNLKLNYGAFGIAMTGNLCYTFNLPQNNIYPYLKLGYGLSNDLDNSSGAFESLNFKTINAGAGLKIKYSSGMAFRLEINYRNLNRSLTSTYSDEFLSSSNGNETTISIIAVLLGVSVILWK